MYQFLTVLLYRDISLSDGKDLRPVRLAYKLYFLVNEQCYFSHIKSVNDTVMIYQPSEHATFWKMTLLRLCGSLGYSMLMSGPEFLKSASDVLQLLSLL